MRTTLRLLLLLLIPYGGKSILGCFGGPTFTAETRAAGQGVSLECPHDNSNGRTNDVKVPQTGESNSGRHIAARQEPGRFVLQISKVRKSDMAVYYCFTWTPWVHDVIFLKGIFLQVTDVPEAEPSISVTQDLWSDESQRGPSLALRCSVLPRLGNKMCSSAHGVYWFRVQRTDDKPPNFIYTREECENVEKGSMQKCIHAFPKDVSASDAGTYACAVATCGEILMGKATKVEDRESSECVRQRSVIFVLGSALTLSFILSALLIYKIKTKSWFYCKACRQTHDETSTRVQQRDEDALVYSAPIVIARKSGKVSQMSARTAEDFSTYADVRRQES
ncbi:uncharacterized protein LOC144026278 [Festucalex cinctus]